MIDFKDKIILIFHLYLLISLEKPDNYTEFNISLTAKLVLSQFLNTGIVTFIVTYLVTGQYIYGEGNFILFNISKGFMKSGNDL